MSKHLIYFNTSSSERNQLLVYVPVMFYVALTRVWVSVMGLDLEIGFIIRFILRLGNMDLIMDIRADMGPGYH